MQLKTVAKYQNSCYSVVYDMGQKEKLILRLESGTKDFTFDELERLLGYFGYIRSEKGKTSGSRVVFTSDTHPPIMLHRPHPGKILKEYQIRQLISILEEEKLI